MAIPRKREKLVLVLKLSVGDVSGERLADLLNNSDLVRAVKAGKPTRRDTAGLGSFQIAALHVVLRITAERPWNDGVMTSVHHVAGSG